MCSADNNKKAIAEKHLASILSETHACQSVQEMRTFWKAFCKEEYGYKEYKRAQQEGAEKEQGCLDQKDTELWGRGENRTRILERERHRNDGEDEKKEHGYLYKKKLNDGEEQGKEG